MVDCLRDQPDPTGSSPGFSALPCSEPTVPVKLGDSSGTRFRVYFVCTEMYF